MHQPYEQMNPYAPLPSSVANNNHTTNTPPTHSHSNASPPNARCVIFVNVVTKEGKMVVQRHATNPQGQDETLTFEVAPNTMRQFMAQQKQEFPNIQFVKNEERPNSNAPTNHYTNNTSPNRSQPAHTAASASAQTFGHLNAYDKFDSNYSHCQFDQSPTQPRQPTDAQLPNNTTSPQTPTGFNNTNC